LYPLIVSVRSKRGPMHAILAKPQSLQVIERELTEYFSCGRPRPAKSSSLVKIAALFCRAYCQIAASLASRNPISRTATASHPTRRNASAREGGSWASMTSFTRLVARRDWLGRRHIAGRRGYPLPAGPGSPQGFAPRWRPPQASRARPLPGCAFPGCTDGLRIARGQR